MVLARRGALGKHTRRTGRFGPVSDPMPPGQMAGRPTRRLTEFSHGAG